MTQRDASLFLVLGVVGLDASAKEAALLYLDGSPLQVLPFLNLTLGFNRGVSFGMFAADAGQAFWAIVVVTSFVSSIVCWLWHKSVARLDRIGYALVLGGALANLLDRVQDGAVTDFLDLHAEGWHFPTFNLADSAIAAGVVLLLVSALSAISGRAVGN
jgi:signal peptidase II